MSDFSLHTRTMIVSRLWMAVQFYFAHWQDVEPDFALEKEISDLMQVAIDTDDRFQFTLEMMRFISRLNNSHSWYYDQQVVRNHMQKRAYKLSSLDDEHWYVKESYVDSLQPGDIISHIEGKSCAEWFTQLRPYMNASSERIARRSFDGRIRMFIPQVSTFTLQDGREIEVDHDLAQPPPPLSERHTTGEWIDQGKIGLIYVPSFNEDRFETIAIEYLEQFKDADTVIIDLRDCTGGNTPFKLIYALMTHSFRMWSEATPVHLSLFHYRYQERAWGRSHAAKEESSRSGYYDAMNEHFRHPMFVWDAPVEQAKTPIFTGNLILLTGIDIGSAGEDFVIPFKNTGRATLIGGTTLGSTGQPYHYHFDEDIWLAIGTKRVYFPDGTRYEGIGIEPDIHIQPTIEDLRAGRDVVMEKALEIARSS